MLRLRQRGRATRTTVSVLVARRGRSIVLTLGVAAWTQTHVWRDSETLWRWAVEMDPACSLCQGNLGSAITTAALGQARLDEAEGHLRRAIELRPDNPIPYFNLGTLLTVRTRYAEAEAALRRYLELLPGPRAGLGRLGLLYLLQGRVEDAAPLLLARPRLAASRTPWSRAARPPLHSRRPSALVEDDPGTLMLLGRALVEQGNPGDAIFALRRAAVLDPSAVPAHFWLVQAYQGAGRDDLAREQLDLLRPDRSTRGCGAPRSLTIFQKSL